MSRLDLKENVDNFFKGLNLEKENELFKGDVFLGKSKKDEKGLELDINSSRQSLDVWKNEKLYDRIAQNSDKNIIKATYGEGEKKTTTFLDKIKKTLEVIFGAFKPSGKNDGEKHLVMFCDNRYNFLDDVIKSALIKKQTFKMPSENEREISMSEKSESNGKRNSFKITDFQIKYPEKGMKYSEDSPEKNDLKNLSLGDAIKLDYDFAEGNKEFAKAIEPKVNEFYDKVLDASDSKGFRIKKFDEKDKKDVLEATRSYNRISTENASPEWIETQSVDNGLALAKEFEAVPIGVDEANSKITYSSGKNSIVVETEIPQNFDNMLSLYDETTKASSLKDFGSPSISINSGKNRIDVSPNAKEMNYTGEALTRDNLNRIFSDEKFKDMQLNANNTSYKRRDPQAVHDNEMERRHQMETQADFARSNESFSIDAGRNSQSININARVRNEARESVFDNDNRAGNFNTINPSTSMYGPNPNVSQTINPNEQGSLNDLKRRIERENREIREEYARRGISEVPQKVITSNGNIETQVLKSQRQPLPQNKETAVKRTGGRGR